MTTGIVAGTLPHFYQFIQRQIDSSTFFPSTSPSYSLCFGMQPDKSHDFLHPSNSQQQKSESQPTQQQQHQPSTQPQLHHHLVTTGFLSDTPTLSQRNPDTREIAARLIQLRNNHQLTTSRNQQLQPPLNSAAFTADLPTTEAHNPTSTSQGLQPSIQHSMQSSVPSTYGGALDAAAFLRYTSHAAGGSSSGAGFDEAPSFSPGSTPATSAAGGTRTRDRSPSNPGRAHRFCHVCKHINHVRRKRCEKCNTPKSVTRMSATSRARCRARRREATEHMLLPAATSPISGHPTASLGSSPLQLGAVQVSPQASVSQHQAQPHPQSIQLGAGQGAAPPSPQHPSPIVTGVQASAAIARNEEEDIQSESDRRRQELDEAIDNALDDGGFPQY